MNATTFSSLGFMPHIHCYLARPTLVWTMFATDLLIGFAYLAISLTLWELIRKINLSFNLVILCFGVFIGACGVTHFMEVWTLWHPDYWVSAGVKAVTAVASVGTAIYLFRLRHLIVETALSSKRLEAQRETRLVSAERDLSDLLERTTDGFFRVSPDWKLISANPVTRQFMALAGRDIIGKSMEELFTSPDRLRFMARYERIAKTGEPERFDEVYEGRLLSVHAYRTEDRSLAVFYRDVTEEREVQQKIADSELRLRTLTEALPQLVWSCRADGSCDYLSPQWIEYTGIPLEEQLRFEWLDRVIHPDDRTRTLQHWIGAVQGLHPYDIEYRIRRRDGAYRWFKTRGVPMRNSESSPIAYWFGTCTDIEDQKRSEQEIQATKQRFEAIANNIPQLAWMTNGDGFIFWYNQNWYDYTGTTLEQMQGWGWKAVHDPEHADRVTAKWQEHLRSGEPWEDTFPLRGKSGEWRWFLSRAKPTRDEQGKILHWLGTNTDITEEREIREGFREAVKARDEFLSIASHELKTPLTSMKLQTQMIKRQIGKQDPVAYSKQRVDQLVEQTDKQVIRLSRLVDDMLDIAKIRSGRLTLERERFDLCELVKEVIDRMRSQFLEAGCGEPQVTACEPAEGNWDRMRIEQILQNLLTNAIRYGRGKTVAVAVECLDQRTRLMVKDQGIGIEKAAQARIFDRFERAVDANEVSGLGLGLYIARQIAEAHGGRIWAESAGPGQGASFHVELPNEGASSETLGHTS